ncbi:MAG: cysteine desulfurase [Lachnospiraceae bacterium]|nr:cysteine desulfurase [Lachnospiraceae bacterium]
MNSIYLDNSATTRTFDEVTEYMTHIMKDIYGNPSSRHTMGISAEAEVKKSLERLARIMKVDTGNILFTSGGTESDNLAIIGGAMANKREGMHLITTKTEHPAVLEPMNFLEEQGFSVTYLDVGTDGRVNPDDLKASLTDETILVSIMNVNNEIGSVNDIREIGAIIKDYKPSILFHTDAVQSFGKFKINPKSCKIDMMSVSGHKIHGPKGVGILYVADKVKLHPLMLGGGQQKGLRSGTENVPGIAGIGLASELIYKDFDEKTDKLYELKRYFIEELIKLPGVYVNGIPQNAFTDEAMIRMTAPHIISASFDLIRAEVLLHALEAKGIYVSSGSACSSNKPSVSATLQAIGLDRKLLDSTLRFSMSHSTTREDIDTTLTVLSDELPKLRKFIRR